MNSLPPIYSPSIFNTNAFQGSIYITKEDADRLYLSISAGKNLGLLDVTPGAVTANKALVFDSNAAITGALSLANNLGDMLVLTSTLSSSRNTIKFVTDSQTYEIGSRGSTASNGGQFYIYNGAYKLLMNSSGDTSILSSTESSSSSTGCLKLTGGLGIAKNCHIDGTLNLNRNGVQMIINNGVKNGLFEVPASVDILRLVRGFAVCIGSNGITIESGSIRDPRSVIDLGQTSSNKQIALYNDTSSYYGISANNSSTQFQSGNGFTFHGGCSDASPNGTTTVKITQNGGIEVPDNQHIRNASNNNMIHLASVGTVVINNSSVSNNGNKLEVNGQSYFSGNIGIGTSGPNFPLQIDSSQNTTISSYGYINTNGNTGFVSGGSGSINVAIKCTHRIVSGEVNLLSDRRIKKDISDIDDEEAISFLNIKPVHYTLKKCNTRSYGYIAQDILKGALKNNKYILEDIINICPEENIEEEIDDDDFLNPAGCIFTVNYPKIVPLLHKIIQIQESKINKCETEINNLNKEIEDLNKRLDEVIDYINED